MVKNQNYILFLSSMKINTYVNKPDYIEASIISDTGRSANIKYSNMFSYSTNNFIIKSIANN